MLYSYDWQATFKAQGTAQNISQYTPPEEVKNKIKEAFEGALKELALEKFSQQFAKLGRTITVNSVKVATDKISVQMVPLIPYPAPFVGWGFYIEVTTFVQFDTDVEQHEHFSPQGWEEILLAIAEAILAVLTTHTLIAALVVLTLVIGIVALAWRLTGTSVWSGLTGGGGGDIASAIFGLAVVAIGGLLLYSWITGRGKGNNHKKRRR